MMMAAIWGFAGSHADFAVRPRQPDMMVLKYGSHQGQDREALKADAGKWFTGGFYTGRVKPDHLAA